MAQSKPILGSINSGNDLQTVIEAAHAGFICNNGDDVQLLANARQLLDNDELRLAMGRNAKRLLATTFSVPAAVKLLLKTC